MLRLLKLILQNPLSIFKLIYYWIHIISLKLNGKKTVVYNLHYSYFYDIFKDIYYELSAKYYVYFSYNTKNEELKKYLLSHPEVNYNKLIPNTISPFLPFDIFICAEITGPDFPIKILHTKNIQMYHGMGTYNLLSHIHVLKRFDIHFAMGKQHNDFFNRYLCNDKKKDYKIYTIGYPKTDRIFDSPSIYIKNKYTDKTKKSILYAPHWHEFSSIHKMGEDIITTLAKLPILLLIKPHNYLYKKYAASNWRERILSLCDKFQNVKFITEADTQIVYPISDMMITDPGTTVSLEFSLLKKPIVIYTNENWFTYKEDVIIERALYDTAFSFKNVEELAEIVKNLIKKDENLLQAIEKQKKEQEIIIKKYFYNPGTSTPKAVEAIEKELAKC